MSKSTEQAWSLEPEEEASPTRGSHFSSWPKALLLGTGQMLQNDAWTDTREIFFPMAWIRGVSSEV